jgi:phosphoglycerate kinase
MMIMEYIENIDTKNKKVILRLDLNVTIKNGEIMDDTKIVKSVPTIKYLLNNGCNILIMSHLGKVKSLEDKMQNSLKPVKDVLEKLLEQEVVFVPNTREPELKSILDSNRLVLLENTRFEDYPGKLESGCDEELSKYWASLGEVFINDAFGTTHRRHASNYGISKYLPSAYGFLIKQELDGLDPIVNNINRPFAVIMGGAKVDDKIALIKTLVKECDYLLVGGGIANTFLKAEGKEIGNSLYSADYVEEVKELISIYKDKINTPIDVVVNDNDNIKTINIEDITDSCTIYDIGPKTVEKYVEILRNSNTIFMNGTMGMYEDENYRAGTELLLRGLTDIKANKVAGGGDAVAAVKKLQYEDAFDFLSTGGGASLEYIADKEINCFKG